MPTFQTAGNVLAALKRETTTGTAATASGATQLRIIDSPGLELKRAQIRSQERRDDGNMSEGRLGGKTVDGSFNTELTVGGATDILVEAIMRSTWSVAATRTYDNSAGLTSLTVTDASTLTQVGTTTLVGVIFPGDVITLGGMSTTANNDLRARVLTVTATVITVAGTPFTIQGADNSCTLTRLKKLISATTPTRYSHTIEQNDQDIDLSELFLGARLVGMQLSFKPGAMATCQWTFQAMDRTRLVNGTSPWFTTPSVTTGVSLIADDSVIYQDGVAVTTFTGFDLNFQITAGGVPVIGTFVSPDVFDNDLDITGTITGLRSDFAYLIKYDAETKFSLSMMLQEPGALPQATFAFYLPQVKIGSLSAPFGGGTGAKTETKAIWVSPQAAATGLEATVAVFHSSAP